MHESSWVMSHFANKSYVKKKYRLPAAGAGGGKITDHRPHWFELRRKAPCSVLKL